LDQCGAAHDALNVKKQANYLSIEIATAHGRVDQATIANNSAGKTRDLLDS
jgi:hypothetical protein